jgi:hypothetical protein
MVRGASVARYVDRGGSHGWMYNACVQAMETQATIGLVHVRTVEADEADPQASEKRVLHPSRWLLYGIISQLQVLFGRKNEHERLSMQPLSGVSHASDSNDGGTV